MTGEELLVGIGVGSIAACIGSFIVGERLGLSRDTVTGILGALLGATLFRTLGVQAPFGGMAGAVSVAFVGAASLLVAVRAFRRARRA